MSITAFDRSPARRVPPLALAIAAYAAVAACVSPAGLAAMLATYAEQMLMLTPVLVAGLGAASLIRRPRAPLSFICDVLRERALPLAATLAGFCLGMAAFTAMKLAIPRLVPFYADPIFADLDAMLVPGSPGMLAHALLPTWAAWPLACLYGPVWFVAWFGIIAYVALSRDSALRKRYFWALALTLAIVGTLLATVLSSVGPVFYDRIYGGTRFAGLMALVDATSVGEYMRFASSYLYDNYTNDAHGFGTGISAMPSVHIAIVTLNAQMLWSRDRRIGALAWAYTAAIGFGSVYLGWHYAVDGLVSLVVVVTIWRLCGRLLSSRQRSVKLPVPTS
jgi:hypothetical protein